MVIEKFVQKHEDAFGEQVALPIAFEYSHQAVVPDCKVPCCVIGAISNVRNGSPLTLSVKNVQCGGSSLYTGFAPMQERIPHFVSEVEHYKRTPEIVRDYVESLHIHLTDKAYINFQRIDSLTSFGSIEGLICFATPDILSGLASWVFYDTNREDAVSVPFCLRLCSTYKNGGTGESDKWQSLLYRYARPFCPATGSCQ